MRLKLKHYWAYAHSQEHAQQDDSPLYIFDGTFADRKTSRALAREYSVPHLFAEDLLQYAGERRRPPYRCSSVQLSTQGALIVLFALKSCPGISIVARACSQLAAWYTCITVSAVDRAGAHSHDCGVQVGGVGPSQERVQPARGPPGHRRLECPAAGPQALGPVSARHPPQCCPAQVGTLARNL